MPVAIPSALVDAVTKRQVVIFAGAGVSFASLGIAGAGLRDAIGAKIVSDFGDYDPGARSFEDVCDEYAAINDRATLVELIAEHIPQDAAPTPAHVAAAKMCRFIVTTNWDLLFEAACHQMGHKCNVLADESDAPAFNYDQHNLLKLHGSVDRPLTIVATTDDYESYADTHPQLLDRLGDMLYSNTVLFVGYGLRDEHVRRLLSAIRRKRGQWSRRAYAIGFYDEVRVKLLDSRRIQVIPASADEVLAELATRAGV